MEVERFGGGGGDAAALGRGHRPHGAADTAAASRGAGGGGRVLAALAAGARREDLGDLAAVLQFAFEPNGALIWSYKHN